MTAFGPLPQSPRAGGPASIVAGPTKALGNPEGG